MAADRWILKFIEALNLSDVTLVANNTGGGIVQAVLGNDLRDFGRVGLGWAGAAGRNTPM